MTEQFSESQNQATNQVFMYLSGIAALLLLTGGTLALWAHTFTSNMVKRELTAQKIYFPEAGSPALNPAEYPDLQQYAGQLVDTPEKAKAYANGYIGRHLKKIADGKVYAEVSAEAMKDPDNQKLQQQKQALFEGETLRGMLLTSGFGFGIVGKLAGMAALIAFAASGAMLVLTLFFHKRMGP